MSMAMILLVFDLLKRFPSLQDVLHDVICKIARKTLANRVPSLMAFERMLMAHQRHDFQASRPVTEDDIKTELEAFSATL